MIAYALFLSPEQEISYASVGDATYEKLADPRQVSYHGNKAIPYNDGEIRVMIYPKAGYRIYAQVMSKKWYMLGWESKLSPYDLALAWNKLMLPEFQNGIHYSQGNRWYYYRYDNGYPLQGSYIQSHSSNHHIIPANDELKKALDRVGKGDKIYMEGFLVYIEGTYKGNTVWWRSSLSRNDSGNGACEILYLTKAIIDDQLYY